MVRDFMKYLVPYFTCNVINKLQKITCSIVLGYFD